MNLSAQASRWYPIDTGRIWIYSAQFGGSNSATVGDPELFTGLLLQPLRWDGDVCEYLSKDGTGRVFLYGVSYPDGGYVVFSPPILRMDSELTLGHEWESITDIIEYNADGTEIWRGRGHSTFSVIALGPADVAAGTFQAAEVLRTEEINPLARTRRSSGASFLSPALQGASLGLRVFNTFRDTYAEGIGCILRTDENGASVLFELEACGVNGVPTESATWGKIKALYK